MREWTQVMEMRLAAESTDEGGMRLSVNYGPLLMSVILDPDDEEAVMGMLHEAFKEARERKHEGNGHVHSN